MSGRITHALFALTLFPAVAGAASITVWEGTKFRGPSTEVTGSVRSLADFGWNDRISSLRIDSGRWEICRETDFRSCQTVDAEEIENLESTWNDAISSLRPVTAAAGGDAILAPEDTVRRLYRGLLGRDPDPQGLRNAAARIRRGELEGLVTAMIQSTEYRRVRSGRTPTQVLDQMYRALLDRPADSTARRSYLTRVDRGEDATVVLELLSSDEYASNSLGETEDEDITFESPGSGLVVWGPDGPHETLTGAKVLLGGDGQARVDFTGPKPHTLSGTWERESEDVVRLEVPLVGSRRSNAQGLVLLDDDKLARVEVIAGIPGARNSALMTFVAGDYTPPAVETLCLQEARAQAEDDRGSIMVMLFLTPDRSRVSTGRDELNGDALALDDLESFTYRCEVDTRRGTVLEASIQDR
jgi:hypothetical protein